MRGELEIELLATVPALYSTGSCKKIILTLSVKSNAGKDGSPSFRDIDTLHGILLS